MLACFKGVYFLFLFVVFCVPEGPPRGSAQMLGLLIHSGCHAILAVTKLQLGNGFALDVDQGEI